jgi:predicted RNA binding protein YcfA (HicA-like mRNA interferase family)
VKDQPVMSKKEKLLRRIMEKPPRKDITYDELETLLSSMGYEKIEGSGSRVSFYHSDKDHVIELHKPHPGNELKLYQILKIQKKLREIL